jgi:hypothetical protein
MNIEINIVSEKYDFVRGPYNFLNKQIKRAKKHQLAWKKVSPPKWNSIQMEPKDMIIFWKIIEAIFILILFAFIQFVKLIYFITDFFKRIFG